MKDVVCICVDVSHEHGRGWNIAFNLFAMTESMETVFHFHDVKKNADRKEQWWKSYPTTLHQLYDMIWSRTTAESVGDAIGVDEPGLGKKCSIRLFRLDVASAKYFSDLWMVTLNWIFARELSLRYTDHKCYCQDIDTKDEVNQSPVLHKHLEVSFFHTYRRWLYSADCASCEESM